MRLADLAAEFPRDAIHWRAQTLTKNGDKALALAYLDARDVMDRLDDVCGPENWQSRYVETAKGRVLCEIGIKIGDEWVWKSDGAGDTAVEGEKGGISDALKRAAVQWGIGRYLYRLDAVWAPCETYDRGGKAVFSKWKGSPWDHVRGKTPPPQQPTDDPQARKYLADAESIEDLTARYKKLPENVRVMKPVIAAGAARKAELQAESKHDAAVKAEREPDAAEPRT